MWRVSLDKHPFDVVELDDTPVFGPYGMREVAINVAQRTSIIIHTGHGEAGDAF